MSFWSSPRSYRNRNTSLILRMDKPFWGIPFLLCARGEIPNRLSSAAFCSNSESPIPRCQYRTRSYRVCSLAARIIHIPGISIHMPGILILILPESLFSSSRNPYSHAPEYASEVSSLLSQPRNCGSTRHSRFAIVSAETKDELATQDRPISLFCQRRGRNRRVGEGSLAFDQRDIIEKQRGNDAGNDGHFRRRGKAQRKQGAQARDELVSEDYGRSANGDDVFESGRSHLGNLNPLY